MRAIQKIAMLAVLAGAIVKILRTTRATRGTHATRDRSSIDDVPVLQPVRDAEPNLDEPLQDADLRVAQNAPF
jgi:hypothetical protein